MSTAAPEPRTFDDLYAEIEALPEGATGEILEPGVVHVTMGRPGRPHRFSFKHAVRMLRRFDSDAGGVGWWIEPEAEVRFGLRMLDLDLAGWRVEHVPEMPRENPIAILPDWSEDRPRNGHPARSRGAARLRVPLLGLSSAHALDGAGAAVAPRTQVWPRPHRRVRAGRARGRCVALRGAPRSRDGRRHGRQTEMSEDGLDDARLVDVRDDPSAPAAGTGARTSSR